ncbi:two-component sensor histidine kinase [Pseudomonas asuensis]|uniref:histidine kinase n=1 Tax=Pseudomonas asuensis TaxID=1825787 RepID=A0ABQ2GMT9_9PSED|nr:two-component sensor histidine kinase [Pseudomonas asuensis]
MVLRTLFWRVFGTFWLAILSAVGLTMLLGHILDQDSWILSRHPGLQQLPPQWVERYEHAGEEAAQRLLERRKRRFGVDIQVLGENGTPLIPGTLPPHVMEMEKRGPRRSPPWRRITTEYTSSESGRSYLFIYHIPLPELNAWRRDSLLFPISVLAIACVVLTLFSLLLTLAITRPLNRLRSAVHDLGRTAYQQDSLAKLSRRRDEFGVLAQDFNRMGDRLQSLIVSQRQLLRDVSHELRSPLARLRIALALAERATPEDRAAMWPRLEQECNRLENLIGEILALARLDSESGDRADIPLSALIEQLCDDAQLTSPEQRIDVKVSANVMLHGWPDLLERALDNLIRNALRFNPVEVPLEITTCQTEEILSISVRDHGPGVAEKDLPRLGEPFYRAPNQTSQGYGLGLAIARRAVERHGGKLLFANHAEGGFIATLEFPASLITRAKS